MSIHITIVGSGIAAIAAAISAESKGADITIIRGRPGATALSSGSWDIAGFPGRFSALPWSEYPPPSECLKEMIRRDLRHPYSLLAQNPGVTSPGPFLEETIGRLSSVLNLRLKGSLAKNQFLLHPLGGIKATAFAPQAHSHGNFLEMKEARLLIVGFRGLPQFSADPIGRFLKTILGKAGGGAVSDIRATEIFLRGLPDEISPIGLAGRLDDDAMIESLHHVLVDEAEKGRTTHIALPPVIGIRKTDHILARLRETTGLIWFEALGLPPSLPGLRLQQAIDRFLDGPHATRWRVVEGEACGGTIQNRRVLSLRTGTNGKEEEIAVDRLVLATGRYIGGGIVKEKSFREPVLNLPLSSEGSLVGDSAGRLTSEKFLEDHPLFSVGVRTNTNLQPVGERGQILCENLWAAGSLIGGYNPAIQHCGMGVAAGTGTLSGRMAAS